MGATGQRLQLSVQYATDGDVPARIRVRRWVGATLAVARTRRPGIGDATLVVRFVDVDEGRALNRSYRGKDYATNVLTFPYEAADDARTVEADIVICAPVVASEALAQRKPAATHCAHLVVHGVLHACGYDHEDEDDAEAMEAIERAVLARFRIVDPYRIVEG